MTSRQTVQERASDAGETVAIGAERAIAAKLSDLLARQGARGVSVIGKDGEAVELSPGLVAMLETAASMLAEGTAVSLLAADTELSSQQAADMLNVSRQYMVRLLDRGDLPSTKVGTHRRVKTSDLAVYRQRRDEGRQAALDVLADQAQAIGGYDQPAQFGPRRPR